ncbi:MAG: energy transducer TonB [Jejuia sp.]
MKNSKPSRELIRQNEQSKTSSQKHDVNLQKNSTLYFQVGLIVCLLAVLGLLEMQFETKIPTYNDPPIDNVEDFAMVAPNFKIYEEPKVESKPKPKEKKVILSKTPKIVEDDFTIKKVLNIDTPDSFTNDEPLDPGAFEDLDIPVEPTFVDFVLVENVPVYPGCEDEKGNEAKRKCMSDKINKLVRKKFNGDIATEYGLSGVQRIYVEFQVDKQGAIKEIKTRAPHPKLEQEAERVVNKIPTMEPGKQRDEPVSVRYTLPIIFKAE